MRRTSQKWSHAGRTRDLRRRGGRQAAGRRSPNCAIWCANLTERVHAQFTTISAHAEIAREQVEFARDEAHADLERTREMLIELIERAREDFERRARASHVPGTPPGPSVARPRRATRATVEARVDEALDGARALLPAPAGARRHDGGAARHGDGGAARRASRRPEPRLTTPIAQRTSSIRIPPSSHSGSIGRRAIARPDARRAVHNIAAASYMWTTPAPVGRHPADHLVDAGQLGADQVEPLDATILVVRRGLSTARRRSCA